MNARAVIEIYRTRKKSFGVLITLFLIEVILFVYVFAYQTPHIEMLQSQWFAKRKATTVDTALDTAAVFRQGESDLKSWRARILPKRDFARFVGNLFEIATHNSLAFKGVTYKVTQVKAEDLVSYTLNFNVSGKYAAIKSFLADLGRMHEIVTVDSINLANAKAAEDAVDLSVQLTVYLRMVE